MGRVEAAPQSGAMAERGPSMANKLTWEDLFSQGTLVDLDVGIWAGLARVLPGDLGIPKTEAVQRALTFGHERLVSKSYLQPLRDLEQAARAAVDNVSITFPLIKGSRYVPRKNRQKLEAELAGIKVEFEAAVAAFLTGYEQHKAEQNIQLRKALMTAAKDPAAVDGAMARLAGKYPGVQALAGLNFMTWRYLAITAPKDGEAATGEVNAVTEALTDITKGLRKEVEDKLAEVLALCARGGKITAKTYNSAKRVLDKIAGLNVFGDAKLAEAVEKFRQVIDGASDAADAGAVLVAGLEPIKAEIAKDTAAAVEAAAKRLTGAASRKFL